MAIDISNLGFFGRLHIQILIIVYYSMTLSLISRMHIIWEYTLAAPKKILHRYQYVNRGLRESSCVLVPLGTILVGVHLRLPWILVSWWSQGHYYEKKHSYMCYHCFGTNSQDFREDTDKRMWREPESRRGAEYRVYIA